MAIRWAVDSGDWSDTETWDGGTIPDTGDDVYANGYVVTIDQNVTANSLSNSYTEDEAEVTSSGGCFTCSTEQIIELQDLYVSTYGGYPGQPILLIEGDAALSVATPILGYAEEDSPALSVTSGTVTINADLIGADGAGGASFAVTGGSITLNGDVVGGYAEEAPTGSFGAIAVGGPCTLDINGDVSGGTNLMGIVALVVGEDPAEITVVGSVIGGVGGFYAAGIITIGNVAVRIGGDMVWSAEGAPPFVTAMGQSPMLMRSGSSTATMPSDDDWPLATGEPITLGADGGGGSAPSEGVGWPPRYWG